MPQVLVPLEPRDGRQPLAKRPVEHRQRHLARDLVEHQVDEFGLAGHVGVDRHRLEPQSLGDAAHRDRLDALVVGELDRGVDDLVDARPLLRPARADRFAEVRAPQQPQGAVGFAQTRGNGRHAG